MGYRFLIDTNLPIDTDDEAVAAVLRGFDVAVDGSTDLPLIGRRVAGHEPDLAYIPSADWQRALRRGDRHYRGFVMPTSKFTGSTDLPSVLVVRKDDPAEGLMDLRGASYGFINSSCTSSYFPPIVMLHAHGIRFADFFDGRPVEAWQGQVDAVTAGEVRATMVPEDVWRTTPGNADTTKVIDRYEDAKPAVIVARRGLDPALLSALTDALVDWVPPWSGVYGCFKPFLYADVHHFFHELGKLPANT
ncbi:MULTISPECIES: phosphate/phosphite/phosphonate ABC transporter substrate-binding protein [Methylobacterium]|uniref:Phosphonate transport system substrate-binding protein n=1 Tax=Methylobacterium phyllostachyos TaxID=582672 RepID=A0A1G9U1B9_9HYPH|nr:PhnD/SsuA/transferrin family substrate-binding protein [Methylobacterium phyllostachyos]SDM53672.1 phosphonate transport system substrate-binding protein [Methylobacterium phyllostachyos]